MTATESTPTRVLLIEDEECQAMLISRMLTHSPIQRFNVQQAATLREGIHSLATGDFDVCLLDLGLPDGTGIDSLHEIRSVDARLPIVVLTGNDDEVLGLTAIETGAQDFVAKDAICGQRLSRALRFAIARQQKMLVQAADANTDTLTGLPNRRKLDDSFVELATTCDELCVALLDIDHFKQINDSHGHLVGDQVLRHLASVISNATDMGIQTARFGGEEFAILMPETNVQQAVQMVESLLAAIENSPLDSDPQIQVTASAGISDVGPDDTLEDALGRTDVALYDAKRSGRNQVCVKQR